MYNIDDLIAFNDYVEGKATTYYQLLKLARDNQHIYETFIKMKQEEK